MKNNGTCFDDNGSTKYTCECSEKYAGEKCEIEICPKNNCLNGGICTGNLNDGDVEEFCNCPDRYKGEFCEEDLCDSIDCLNNGTCLMAIVDDNPEQGFKIRPYFYFEIVH